MNLICGVAGLTMEEVRSVTGLIGEAPAWATWRLEVRTLSSSSCDAEWFETLEDVEIALAGGMVIAQPETIRFMVGNNPPTVAGASLLVADKCNTILLVRLKD